MDFDGFDVQKITNYQEPKIQELLLDARIIRHQLKIRSAVLNANLFIEIQKECGSFSNYLWGFVHHKPIINYPKTLAEVQSTMRLYDSISKNLKKRGFKFVGPTVIYSDLQAVGIVNDHVEGYDFK